MLLEQLTLKDGGLPAELLTELTALYASNRESTWPAPMAEYEETNPTVRVGGESPRAIKLCFQGLTRSFPEEQGNPLRDFLVTAESEAVQVKVTVRTWAVTALTPSSLNSRKSSRGWAGAKTWRSLERDLTIAAEHAGSHVKSTWGLHGRLPQTAWHFEATTNHAPGEDIRNLSPWRYAAS